jgi:hypothetical protein
MSKTPVAAPVIQDLGKPDSLISQAFARFVPPVGPHDPDGTWTHVYQDISSFSLKHVQGGLTLRHQPSGKLRIESFRNCPSGYKYWTLADLQCAGDVWHTPVSWTVESKVAKASDGPTTLNSRMTKQAAVKDGVLTIQTGKNRRQLKLPGRYTCKWCLLDAVGGMAKQGTKAVSFTLLDEYDEPCPEQTIRFRGKTKVKTQSGSIEVYCYQHTGIAAVPGMFYVDTSGRTLFYLAGMELLALAGVDGKKMGDR